MPASLPRTRKHPSESANHTDDACFDQETRDSHHHRHSPSLCVQKERGKLTSLIYVKEHKNSYIPYVQQLAMRAIDTVHKNRLKSIAISIIRLRASEGEPVELPNPPTLLLGLYLVPSQFLLLPDSRRACSIPLGTTCCRCGMCRSRRRLQTRACGGVRAAAPRSLSISKGIFHDRCFAFVRNATCLYVPDFGTCIEGVRVRVRA